METSTPASEPDQQETGSRERILNSAERLIAEKGYAAASISDIARASGLPPGSIYWHFDSKAGVLNAVLQRGAQRFFTDVQEARPRIRRVHLRAGRR
ncbi:TetR/AcrR family transcriptional regulator [Actinoplanes xinjiangensis]|uniref:TetR/AcrR family transcriptional regulator n=1 Tax=Actinoplanes xinjiangensis TaxID=512350 RepID=UPI003440D631